MFTPSQAEKERATKIGVTGDIKVHPLGNPKSKLSSSSQNVFLGADNVPLRYRIALKYFRCLMSPEMIHRIERRAVSFRPHAKNLKDGDAMIHVYEPENFQYAGNAPSEGDTEVRDHKNPTAEELEKYKVTAAPTGTDSTKRRMTFTKGSIDLEKIGQKELKPCIKYRYGLYPSTVRLNEIFKKGKMVKDAQDLRRYKNMSQEELREELELLGIPFKKYKMNTLREEWIACLMNDPRRLWGMNLIENVEKEEESETESDSSEDEDDVFYRNKNKKIKRNRELTEKEVRRKEKARARRALRLNPPLDEYGERLPRKRYKPKKNVHFCREEKQILAQMENNELLTSKMEELISDTTDYNTNLVEPAPEGAAKVRILPIVRINVIEGYYNFYNEEAKKRLKAQDLWWTKKDCERARDSSMSYMSDEDGMPLEYWLKLSHFQVMGYFSDYMGEDSAGVYDIFQRAQRYKIFGTEQVTKEHCQKLYYHLLCTREHSAEERLWRYVCDLRNSGEQLPQLTGDDKRWKYIFEPGVEKEKLYELSSLSDQMKKFYKEILFAVNSNHYQKVIQPPLDLSSPYNNGYSPSQEKVIIEEDANDKLISLCRQSVSQLEARNTTGYVHMRLSDILNTVCDEDKSTFCWYNPETRDVKWHIHHLGPRLGEIDIEDVTALPESKRLELQKKLSPLKGRKHISRWTEYWHHTRELPSGYPLVTRQERDANLLFCRSVSLEIAANEHHSSFEEYRMRDKLNDVNPIPTTHFPVEREPECERLGRAIRIKISEQKFERRERMDMWLNDPNPYTVENGRFYDIDHYLMKELQHPLMFKEMPIDPETKEILDERKVDDIKELFYTKYWTRRGRLQVYWDEVKKEDQREKVSINFGRPYQKKDITFVELYDLEEGDLDPFAIDPEKRGNIEDSKGGINSKAKRHTSRAIGVLERKIMTQKDIYDYAEIGREMPLTKMPEDLPTDSNSQDSQVNLNNVNLASMGVDADAIAKAVANMGGGGDSSNSSQIGDRHKSGAVNKARSIAAGRARSIGAQFTGEEKPKRLRSKFLDVNMDVKSELTKNARKVLQAASSTAEKVGENSGASTKAKRLRSIKNIIKESGVNLLDETSNSIKTIHAKICDDGSLESGHTEEEKRQKN